MMLQPVDTTQKRITLGQCGFQWLRMLLKLAALLIDAGPQRTMPYRQSKAFFVHSD